MRQSKLQTELEQRGLIEHMSAPLEDILKTKRGMYVGVDPTADSMHVGNLVPIILIKHLADAGHTPHLLVGGATGMIGDPRESGERQLLDTKTLERNKRAIKAQLAGLLNQKNLAVVNNADWLKSVKLIEFLRDIGKHFTVNQLIKRDIISRRLAAEDSISYTEFSYSLLQGYDFLHLYKQNHIDLQVGGTDQWANILSGIELIRRKEQGSAYALTTPMVIDKTSGKKFGKSEGNAVWLDPAKTSPFSFYQFWINTADENVSDYLKIFSFSSLKKIENTLSAHAAEPHKRHAQRLLARDMTDFVHGKETRLAVERASDVLYGKKSLTKLTPAERDMIIQEIPHIRQSKRQARSGIDIITVLMELGFADSKSNARKLIEGNGVTVNGQMVDVNTMITHSDYQDGVALIRKGKKVGALHLA